MKIAIIGQKGIPATYGGVEKHVEELSVRLARAGHEVFVYVRKYYTPSYLNEFRGVKLISLPSIRTKHLDAISHTFLACFDVLKRNVDVIHFHSIGPSSLIWLIKIIKPNTPVIATFHSQCYHHQKWGSLAKIFLKFSEYIINRWPDKTIAISKVLQTYARQKYGTSVEYIPNGVSTINTGRTKALRQWGLTKGGYIVTVSRLIRHKGIHHLINAYKTVKTGKKLVIIGDGSYTEDYVRDLYGLAKNNPNIIFTGTQTGETLAELFSAACFFVQPSESEGLSISLLEAMSYGLPVLVSDIPENREAIGEYGFTFRNKDAKDLAAKLRYMLNHPALLKKRARLNKSRVKKAYNWDIIAENIIEIYLQVIIRKLLDAKRLPRLALVRGYLKNNLWLIFGLFRRKNSKISSV